MSLDPDFVHRTLGHFNVPERKPNPSINQYVQSVTEILSRACQRLVSDHRYVELVIYAGYDNIYLLEKEDLVRYDVKKEHYVYKGMYKVVEVKEDNYISVNMEVACPPEVREYVQLMSDIDVQNVLIAADLEHRMNI